MVRWGLRAMPIFRHFLTLAAAVATALSLTACAMPISVGGYTADYSVVFSGNGIADINGGTYQVTLEPSGVTCSGRGTPTGIMQGREEWTCSDGRTATLTSRALDPFGTLWRGDGAFSDGSPIVYYGGVDGAGVSRHVNEARQRQAVTGGTGQVAQEDVGAPAAKSPSVAARKGTTASPAPVPAYAPSPYLRLTLALVPQSPQSAQAAMGGAVQLRDFLALQFKTVREVDSLATARMVGADMVAVYHVTSNYDLGFSDTATASASLDLMTADGRLIERLSGNGRNDGFVADLGAAVNQALDQVRQGFQRSVALRDAAQTMVAQGPASPPQAPAPTPAPAPGPRVAAAPPPAPAPVAPKFPTAPVAINVKAAQVNPDDVAVIIGNADYGKMGKDIPDVVPAYADAESFKQFAIKGLGIREGNIIDLRDATGSQFTRVFGTDRNHEGQLYDWVRPGRSRVWVYYAGHGAPGGEDGGAYLVPADADATRIDLNGYPLNTLYANLAKLPAKSVTVVVEACFSGASQGGAVISNASPIFLKAKTPDVPKGLTLISAGGPNEMASWEQDRTNSLFTKYYVKGMAGEADKKPYGNGDGKVTLPELDAYLKETVTYYARRFYGRDQTAVILAGE